MAASICWRTPRVVAQMIAPPRSAPLSLFRRGLHRFSCVRLLGPTTSPAAPAPARLMAARSSSLRSLNGLAPCRAAAARDGDAAGQDGLMLNDFVRDNAGGIHVIVGPMFAGKTTALLNRIREEADAGRRVGLVKSDKDNRYAVSAVVSHDGVQMPCVAVPSLAAFREYVGEEKYRQIDVIGIDEAQFFDDLLEFCLSAADLDNKTVIVAGLDGDFLRRRFGSALDLIPLADSVTKLQARCELCNQPAPFTFRKTVDTKTELIGGADVYMPVCRHHFVSGQCAVETARTVLQESQQSIPSAAEDLQVKPLQPTNSTGSSEWIS